MKKSKVYNPDDYLMISGIQHFVFCRRQWSLIHIEQAWSENYFTMDGQLKHERAHDRTKNVKRKNIIELRSMPVSSPTLGIYGVCDVVELHTSSEGVYIPKFKDKFSVFPIEYKRGQSKSNDSDRLQLLAQAVCLEEMLVTQIPKGAIFYFETRRREVVEFSDPLREKLKDIVSEMHRYYDGKITPKVRKVAKCKSCSLKDQCLYELGDTISAKEFIDEMIKE